MISFRNHNANKKFFVRRFEQNQIEKHDIEFKNDDEFESVKIIDLNAKKKNENENDEIDCDKSVRISARAAFES